MQTTVGKGTTRSGKDTLFYTVAKKQTQTCRKNDIYLTV